MCLCGGAPWWLQAEKSPWCLKVKHGGKPWEKWGGGGHWWCQTVKLDVLCNFLGVYKFVMLGNVIPEGSLAWRGLHDQRRYIIKCPKGWTIANLNMRNLWVILPKPFLPAGRTLQGLWYYDVSLMVFLVFPCFSWFFEVWHDSVGFFLYHLVHLRCSLY